MPKRSTRELAWDILQRVERHGAWADALLDRLPVSAGLSAADARLCRELVLGTLKQRRFLDHALDSLYADRRRPQPAVRRLLRLGAYQILCLERIPAHAAVHETVATAKAAGLVSQAGLINALLRTLARQGAPPLPPPVRPLDYYGVRFSLPDFLVARWLERYGPAQAERLFAAANAAPPLTARVNRMRRTRAEAAERLNEAGVSVGFGQAPDALRLDAPGRDPAALPGFAEGVLYYQDEGSQWVADLVDPQPGERCLDLCAAPGGKATHLAERLAGAGWVAAYDVHAGKRRLLRDNAHRLGLENVHVLDHVPENERYDRVLVDAPCSGLGTLRRHPEIRWRIRPDDFTALCATQTTLLAQGAAHVRPGGVLVYTTCTTEPEENEAVVAHFLRTHPNFTLEPGPGSTGEPGTEFWDTDGYFRTYPRHPEMDGMFGARLRRTS